MKKNFVLTVVLILAILATTVHAAVLQAETAPHIKVVIDGVVQNFKDANGNKVDPVIINGSTYLPLRPIAGAFDKDVNWDPDTSTITIGSAASAGPVNLVDVVGDDQRPYTKYTSKVKGEANLTFPQFGDVGVKYQTAIKVSRVGSLETEGFYELTGSYSTLSCTLLFIPYRDEQKCTVKISDNDRGVECINQDITPNTLVQVNGADITGVRNIKISAKSDKSFMSGDGGTLYILNPIVQ